MSRGKNEKKKIVPPIKEKHHESEETHDSGPAKPAEPHRDWTPNVIDNPVERRVGTANPTSVPGKGRPSS